MGQYPGWPEALAQTLEKIDLCIARRQALGPGLEKFLKKY
jgi:alanyl aminopeptidase